MTRKTIRPNEPSDQVTVLAPSTGSGKLVSESFHVDLVVGYSFHWNTSDARAAHYAGIPVENILYDERDLWL